MSVRVRLPLPHHTSRHAELDADKGMRLYKCEPREERLLASLMMEPFIANNFRSMALWA